MDSKSTIQKYIKHILSILCVQKIEVKIECKILSRSFLHCFVVAFLRYTKTGQLAIAGFCDPHKDPTEADLCLWMPDLNNPPRDLDLAQARFLLAKVADQFCDLFIQEKMATPENMAGSKYSCYKS